MTSLAAVPMTATALPTLTVLSPHRDDAAFSLALTMMAWADAGGPVHIINWATRSDFALFEGHWRPDLPTRLWLRALGAPTTNPIGALRRRAVGKFRRIVVSRLRAEEDRTFIRSLGATARATDLGVRDAPVRFRCRLNELRTGTPLNDARRAECDALADRLRWLLADQLVLTPMGLGEHVDHRIVRAACMAHAERCSLAFYEDQPYRGELTDDDVRRRVDELAVELGQPLRPVTLGGTVAVERKREAIAAYRSQILPEHAEGMLADARDGERVWMTEAFAAALGIRDSGI